MFSVLPSFVIDHVFKTWSYGVMFSVLPSCVIDHVFKTWSCGVMVSVLPSSGIDHVFKTWSCGTKDSYIGTCCFSTKHTTLVRKRNDWLARNQDNVSKCGEMSTCTLLF
jgi:hypothetical protein